MRYKSYKKVNLPWVKEIPEHWDIVAIKRFADIYTGNSIPDEKKDNYTEDIGARSYISTKDIRKGNNSINYDNGLYIKDDDYSFKIAPKGASLVCIEGGSGGEKVGYLEQEVSFVNKLCCIAPYSGFNDRFVFYLLLSNQFKLQYNMAITGDRNGVNLKKLSVFDFIIPPIEEQNKIVKFLDWKINEIDRLIGVKREKNKLFEEFKRVKIINTVIGKNNSQDVKRFSVPEIQSIPSHWVSIPLSRIAKKNNKKNSKGENTNLLSLSYGKIIRKDIESTFGLLPDNFDSYQIVNKGMTVLRLTDLQNDKKSLRSGLVKDKGIITSAYLALIIDDKLLLPEYFYLTMHVYDLLKIFYRLGSGLRQSISYNEIKNLLVFIPPLNEQAEIIEQINFIENSIEKYQKNISEQILTLEQLKQSIIYDVVTGKVDIRNIKIPEYEKVEVVAEEENIDLELE